MNAKNQAQQEELAAKIEPLRQQIETSRRTRARNEPMPAPLWAVATGLAKEYGIRQTLDPVPPEQILHR